MAQPGQVLSGRYELGERLGRGGMAEVFRARDTVLERDVAIKVLASNLADDEKFLERFRREARSAARLNHPNVVSIFDTGTDGDDHYILMELVDGPSLEDILADLGRIDLPRALDIAMQVCAALTAAHAVGVVHRDIKPGNVLFNESGTVKVTDFGIAHALDATALTQTVYGSVPYIAPEQARGEEVDPRADLYGLGCVLYEMVTGTHPYGGDTPVAIVYQHLHADLPPPSSEQASLSGDLDAVVLHALAKAPKDRYQSAEEFREDLQRVSQGRAPIHAGAAGATAAQTMAMDRVGRDEDRTVAIGAVPPGPGGDDGGDVPPTGPPPGTGREPNRRSWIAVALVLLALLAILAGAWALGVLNRPEDEPLEPLAPLTTAPVQTTEPEPEQTTEPEEEPTSEPESPSPEPTSESPTPTPTPTPTQPSETPSPTPTTQSPSPSEEPSSPVATIGAGNQQGGAQQDGGGEPAPSPAPSGG